ncbi:hypothetical protein U1Q18_051392 [Sarracenia purpurea var. burkii]
MEADSMHSAIERAKKGKLLAKRPQPPKRPQSQKRPQPAEEASAAKRPQPHRWTCGNEGCTEEHLTPQRHETSTNDLALQEFFLFTDLVIANLNRVPDSISTSQGAIANAKVTLSASEYNNYLEIYITGHSQE